MFLEISIVHATSIVLPFLSQFEWHISIYLSFLLFSAPSFHFVLFSFLILILSGLILILSGLKSILTGNFTVLYDTSK